MRAPSSLCSNPAVGLALLAAALFGASTPLAKLWMAGMSAPLAAGILYLGSGVGLALLGALRLGRVEAPLRRADGPWLAGATLAGGVLAPLLLFVGLRHTPGATAALLLNFETVATAGIAWLVFRESVDRRVFAGFAVILAGAVLLSAVPGAGRFAVSPAAVAILGACLLWGVDNNLTRAISGRDARQIAMVKGLVAGAVNLGLALGIGTGGTWIWTDALALGVVGFFGYGCSLVLFILALRALGTARTGAYFATAPFLGAVLSVVVLGESVTWPLGVAGALMALGVWLHATERHEHAHEHLAEKHEHLHSHDAHHRHEHEPGDPPGEPHSHPHRHAALRHRHPHQPDIHHRHPHCGGNER